MHDRVGAGISGGLDGNAQLTTKKPDGLYCSPTDFIVSLHNTAVAVRKLLLRPPRRDMILEFMPEQLKLRTELAMQLVGAVTDRIKATARGRPCRPEFPNDHMAARFHSTLDLYGFRSSWKL